MGRLTLFLLQNGRVSADLLQDLRERLEDVREVLERGGDDLVVVIAYTRTVGKVDPARWRAFLRDELNTCPEQVMGAAEKFAELVLPWLREQAEIREREARHQGKAELVQQLLEARFGALAKDVDEHLKAASLDDLQGIAQRLFTAQSLREALGER
jgi:hypothetical protein